MIFRETARAFLEYSEYQSNLPPEHLDCENCIDCQNDRKTFEDALKQTLTKAAGDAWKDYGISSLLSTVIDISEIESTSREKWSITTDRLIKILTSERNRLARIERYNSRKPANT